MTDLQQDAAITALQTQLSEISQIISLLPDTYMAKLSAKSQISVLSGKIADLEAEIETLKNRVSILET